MAVLEGAASGHQAEITIDGELLVALTADPSKSGYVRIVNSDGNDIDTTENNYLRVSTSALVLYEQVDGSSVNTNVWNQAVSGMTITQANGFINLNAAGSLVSGQSAILSSIKYVPLYGSLPLLVEITGKCLNLPQANGVVELGIGLVSGATAPTDGAFFRWTSTGGFFAVINYGGSETTSANLSTSGRAQDGTALTNGQFFDSGGEVVQMPPTNITTHLYALETVEDHVKFYIDDILVADVQVPSGQAYPVSAGRQPVFVRVYNSGTTSLAPQFSIGQVTVKQEDLYQNKTWAETLAVLGRGAYQHPTTFGTTANGANSTNPSSASLSNTVAGYTTLGGRFQFAAVGGAATDYALFALQVPVGFQFFCTGVDISSINTGAIGGLTGTILEWSLGINSSAVSLATADGSGTWAPRRIPLGFQSFGISAAIGTVPPDISRRFPVPETVDSGRFLHIILQLPVGLATVSQIIRGVVAIHGYWE